MVRHPIVRTLVVLLLVVLVWPLAGSSAARVCVVPDIITEAWYDDAWNDISADVFNVQSVQVIRGSANESDPAVASPGTATLRLNNGTSNINGVVGRYSPRNPRSDLYGKIGRNTPIRQRVNLTGGTPSTRFTHEVVSWPARWDLSGSVAWVPLQTAGPLRRLGRPERPLSSAPRRYLLATDPVAYWPLDDLAAQDLISGRGFHPFWKPELVTALAPWLGDGVHISDPTISIGAVVTMPDEGEWTVDWMIRTLDEGRFENTFGIVDGSDGQTLHDFFGIRWDSGNLELRARVSEADYNLDLAIDAGFLEDHDVHHMRLHAVQDGADIDWELFADGASLSSGTITSETLTPVIDWVLFRFTTDPSGNYVGGHVAMWATNAPLLADAVDAAFGHVSEPALTRASRLCDEEGVAFSSTGSASDSTPMGPQRPRQFLELLTEAAHAEAAGSAIPVLTEQRAATLTAGSPRPGLHFTTRRSLYNAAAGVELDYEAGHISAPFDPTPDDQNIANDVTARRAGGGEARVVDEDGPLGVDAVGLYDVSSEYNVASDSQVASLAGWELHSRTVDEDRYPTIRLDLRSLATRTPDVTDDVIGMDAGTRLTIDNLPEWMPPDLVDQLVLGYSETYDLVNWDIT